MALVKCVSCNESYSDSLTTCPHCGFTPHVFICPECGSIYGDNSDTCPACGFKLKGKNIPASKADLEKALFSAREKLNNAHTDIQLKQAKKAFEVLASQYDVSEEIRKCSAIIDENAELARKELIITFAKDHLSDENEDIELTYGIIKDLRSLDEHEDKNRLLESYQQKYNRLIYSKASSIYSVARTTKEWQNAKALFELIPDYPEAVEKASLCADKIHTIEARKKRRRIIISTTLTGIIVAVTAVISCYLYFIPNHHYRKGVELFSSENYKEAIQEFQSAGDYKDATIKAETAQLAQYYSDGVAAFASEDYTKAISCFSNANGYLDSQTRLAEAQLGVHYTAGKEAYNKQDFLTAIDEYTKAGSFADAQQLVLASRYAHADQLYENGELRQAAKEFSDLDGFEDSKERVFTCAETMLQLEDYQNASEAFDLVDEPNYHSYSQYALGKQAMQKKKYKDAVTYFKSAGEIEDAKSLYMDASYEYAESLMLKKDYTNAKTYFSFVENRNNIETLINACDLLIAEDNYNRGYLNTAKEQLTKLPQGFSYNGISVNERLASLDKYKTFVAMCGKWAAKGDCTIESRQTFRSYGNWENWTSTLSNPPQYLTINCIINSDGTVTVKGTAEMYRYTNYSVLSAYLEGKSFSVSFAKKLFNTPNNTEMATNFILSYNANNNSFTAVNTVIDETSSAHFDYTYVSTYIYGTKTQSY